MKLKKIASLALAGIMAVSMLAGCKDGGNSNSGSSSSEDTSTTSGYSAMLGQKAASDLKKNDRDEIFTFADNADDQKILEKIVLRNVADQNVVDVVKGIYVNNRQNDTSFAGKLDTAFKTEKDKGTYGVIGGLATNNYDSQNSTYFAEVYVANGSVAMDVVMDEIYEDLKDQFVGAVKTNNATSGTTKLNYEYTVSVSVVNKPVTGNTLVNGSANFIAVTVTRTAEVA